MAGASTTTPALRRALVAAATAVVIVAGFSACGVSGPYTTFTVNTTVDGPDATADGVCEMTPDGGDCSLRAAVDEANATTGDNPRIVVPSGTYHLTRTGVDDSNDVGDLDLAPIGGDLLIEGQAPGAVIDTDGAEAGLDVRSGNIALTQLAVTHATTAGITARTSTITSINAASLHHNTGAGLLVEVDGLVVATNVTISTNEGAGVTNAGGFVAMFSTVTANGGGLTGTGSSSLKAAVVANQTTGPDCSHAIDSVDQNLDSDGTCGLGDPLDQPATDPLLGPLTNGPLPGHPPLPGSPVTDAVPCDPTIATDQHDNPRPTGPACDPGALETTLQIIVDNPADLPDAAPGDGTCDTGDGTCTLRAAIDETNAASPGPAHTISLTVDPTLTRTGTADDTNTNGDLDLHPPSPLTIDGNGHTLDAAGIDRALQTLTGTTANITMIDLTITGGAAIGTGGGGPTTTGPTTTISTSTSIPGAPSADGGAIRHDAGRLVLVRSTVTANSARHGGGIYQTAGTLELDASTISGNQATGTGADGGGLYRAGGPATLVDSTINANTAADRGGGVYDGTTNGPLTITTSTLSGNAATTRGGGLYTNTTTSITASTITGNTAPTGGPAIYRGSGTTTLKGTILDGAGPDCVGTITSGGYNLDSDDSCGTAQPTDLPPASPLLGPLAGNGGPTLTHLPYLDSPAVDAIPLGTSGLCDASASADQRGEPRPDATACDVGAVEGSGSAAPVGLELTVDTATDSVDPTPGDGTCGTGPGGCSLRAAISETNSWPGPDSITIAAGIDPVLSLTGTSEDNNGTGDLDIRDHLTIDGQGAIIDADHIDRVVHVLDNSATLADLTITGGTTAGGGGGIRLENGGLLLTDASLTSNAATSSSGGGVYQAAGRLTLDASTVAGNTVTGSSGDGGGVTQAGGSLTVTASTISGNTASDDGGAIYQAASAAQVTITNSTVSGNSAVDDGGGIVSRGSATLAATTVADNTATDGSAIFRVSGTSSLTASVMAGHQVDCVGSITSQGYNIDSDGSCGLIHPTDRPPADPLLAPLAPNGGPTLTLLPASDSPVVDVIPAGTPDVCDATTPTDQRGSTRPVGSGCDVGAVEGSGPSSTPLALTVDSAADTNDPAPGDGTCGTGPGGCTLRAAITETNAYPTPDTIVIAAGVDPALSITGTSEDNNATGDLDIRDHLTIDGQGATVDANSIDRAFHTVDDTATLTNLTITDGSTTGSAPGGGLYLTGGFLSLVDAAIEASAAGGTGGGGGIYQASGTLIVAKSSIAGNVATGSSRDGGGMALAGGATIITDSTISANTAVDDGGGVFQSSTNSLTIHNSTISGNATGDDGGGILTGGAATIAATTVADNTALDGQAISRASGTTTVSRSILRGVGADCVGTVTSAGYNVGSDGSCGVAQPTDLPSTNPLLGPLTSNGGPTRTRLPAADSPAIDAIPIGTAGFCDGTTPNDQRGQARPDGPGCDIGAVEGSGPISSPLALVVDSATDSNDPEPGDGVCGTGPGGCTLRAAVTETNAWPTPDTITIAPGVDPTLTLTGNTDETNAAGDLDIRDHLSIDGQGATLDANHLDRGIDVRDGTVDLTGLTVTNGQTATFGTGGGLRLVAGTLTASSLALLDNTATSVGGGGMSVEGGSATVSASTIDGNAAAGYGGGGVYIQAGTLSIVDSSITENSSNSGGAGTGGGISHNGGTLTLAGVTISSNVVGGSGSGGGYSQSSGTATIVNSTFDSNTATYGSALTQSSPGGTLDISNTTIIGDAGWNLVNVGGTVTVRSSLISGDEADCWGTVVSAGFNLDSDGTCGLTHATDLAPTNPLVGPLADNGGPTLTHLPASNSPVVNAIPAGTPGVCDGTTPTDQRGQIRPASGACDIGAVEGTGPATPPPLDLVVDIAADVDDPNPGDGTCGTGPGGCSIRAAVTEANAWPTHDYVTIAPGVDPVLGGSGLQIWDHLTIDGQGATIHVENSIDESVRTHDDVTILTRLELTGPGSGIHHGGGALVLDQSIVSSNVSQAGAIYQAAGSILITRSAIVGNQGSSSGFNDGSGINQAGGNLEIENSTISANVGAGSGVGLLSRGTVAIRGSTISGNRGPTATAIRQIDGTVTVSGSIIAGPGNDCQGTIVSGGHNIGSDASCGLTAATDLDGIDALLGPLGDNGGPTPTLLPFADSPALDAVPIGTAGLCDGSLPTDQRGEDRPSSAGCDIGAIEGNFPTAAPALMLEVDTAVDAPDTNPSDGLCDIGDGSCSLRAAVAQTNAWPTADAISIDPGVDPMLTLLDEAVPGADVLDLEIEGEVTIDGNGAVLDATPLATANDATALTVRDGAVTINDLEITGGTPAIRHRGGSLVIEGSTIAGNSALFEDGGGIIQTFGDLKIVNSTITTNQASGEGGGLWLDGPDAVAVVTHSTIAGNAAASGSAVAISSGSLTVGASILAGVGPDCAGSITSLGHNIASDTSCGLDQPTDTMGVSPLLGPLADNGGPTATRLPPSNSIVVDAIPVGTPGLCDGTVAVDQRGVLRPQSAACDIGAVEGTSASPALPLDLHVDSPADIGDANPGNGLCDSGGGSCTLRAAIDEANAYPTADSITITPGVDPTLTLTGGAENTNAAGDLDVTDHLTLHGSGATVDAVGIDRVFHLIEGVISIDDLTITGGSTTGNGGGIHHAADGDLSLSNVQLTSNTASEGGGLYQAGGSATISNSELATNTAGIGGGILQRQGDLAITTTVISNNTSGGIAIANGTLTVDSSEIRGNASGIGAGLLLTNPSSNEIGHPVVTVSRSSISENTAMGGCSLLCIGGWGGGVGQDSGTLTILDSTISANVAQNGSGEGRGGGVWVSGNGSPVLTIVDTTITANIAGWAGGVWAAGATTLRGTTVSANIATDPTDASAVQGPVTVQGSILAGTGTTCEGAITSAGYNVASSTSCTLTHPTDQAPVDPLLTPLASNGGPTQTMMPYLNSPAVDAIPVGTVDLCDASTPTDQRGSVRPLGAACDIGAVEGDNGAVAVPGPLSLIVDSPIDQHDALVGDGVCDVGDGSCTLRAALDETNVSPQADTITIAPGLDPVLTLTGASDDLNASGDLDINDVLTIDGQGATISAAGLDRVVHIRSGQVVLNDLTLTGGSAAQGAGLHQELGSASLVDVTITGNASSATGGGLYLQAGTLDLTDSTVSSNTASSAVQAPGGGGIYQAGGTLNLTSSVVADNTSSSTVHSPRGGGINQAGGILTILRSTLSGNTALGTTGVVPYGGGIYQSDGSASVMLSTLSSNAASGTYFSSGGGAYAHSMTITLSTVRGNSAAYGAGVHRTLGTVRVKGSVFDNGGKSCHGTLISDGYNLVSDATCAFAGTGDVSNTNPLLGPLADNGGPTRTHLPGVGSAARDAIPAGTTGLCDGTVSTDQRGVARPTGAACDRGSVEQ